MRKFIVDAIEERIIAIFSLFSIYNFYYPGFLFKKRLVFSFQIEVIMKTIIVALFCFFQVYACGSDTECECRCKKEKLSESNNIEISPETTDELLKMAFENMRQNNNAEALENVELALNYPLMPNSLYTAYMIKAIVCARLGQFENSNLAYENFKKYCPFYPRKVETKTHIYIYNGLDSDEFRNKISQVYILTGKTSQDKIKWENNIGIFEKIQNEETNCSNKKCGFGNPTSEDCYYWCQKLFLAGQAICSVSFGSNPFCLAACMILIESIRDNLCEVCCDKGGWATTCSKHFENFVEKVGCEECIM